jgi:thiol-disulfide isomerase/thioredoxin
VDQRDEAISYEGEDLDGDQVSLQDFRGKPVVVPVWGSWCAPCRKEAPWVAGAAEELGDKVRFVGIDLRDAGTAQAQAFERSFGYDFPSFYEPDGAAMLAFPGVLGPRTIPAFVVLDAEGRVAASIIGKLPSQQTLVDLAEDVARETGETRDG